MKNGAIVLLSGGQDSTTCLAIAKEVGYQELYTVAFDYGQRHRIELDCAEELAINQAQVTRHFVIPINSFSKLGGSALVEDGDISAQHARNPALPASFVPGRNYIFLGLAAALAYQLDVPNLWTGVCQTDYSGYPDCRAETMHAVEAALRLAMDYPFKIHTPLMHVDKRWEINLMVELGKLNWLKFSHTCYNGKRPPCMECPACKLRAKGFEAAGIQDPLMEVK